MSPFWTRLIIFVFMTIVYIIIIEPEKIQFLSYFTTSVIISIGKGL